jgi:hypothetical protein
MHDERKPNTKITLSTLKAQMQPMPHPRNTCEFPAGLISEYIKMVDKLRQDKEKKSA